MGGTRFFLLPWVPLLRLIILVAAVVGIAPLVVKPTPENLLALFGAGGLAIGFAFKDYLSCLLAGIVLLIERPYRVGDWVQIGDTFGEVTQIDLRTVSIRTPDDNQVLIPHATIWTTPISNATCGLHELLAPRRPRFLAGSGFKIAERELCEQAAGLHQSR